VLHSLRENLDAAERQIHHLTLRISKQDQDISYMTDKIDDIDDYAVERVNIQDKKIDDAAIDIVDAKLIIDKLRKENYEIYDCIGLIDKRVAKMNDKIKTRARKRDVRELNESLDEVCKQIYAGK
jgi:hypothetical protein